MTRRNHAAYLPSSCTTTLQGLRPPVGVVLLVLLIHRGLLLVLLIGGLLLLITRTIPWPIVVGVVVLLAPIVLSLVAATIPRCIGLLLAAVWGSLCQQHARCKGCEQAERPHGALRHVAGAQWAAASSKGEQGMQTAARTTVAVTSCFSGVLEADRTGVLKVGWPPDSADHTTCPYGQTATVNAATA